MQIKRVGDVRCVLNEGPVWDVAQQDLNFTDVLARRFRRYDPSTPSFTVWGTPQAVLSLALDENGGAVVAMPNDIYGFFCKQRVATLIANPESDSPATIFNDGKRKALRFRMGPVGVPTDVS